MTSSAGTKRFMMLADTVLETTEGTSGSSALLIGLLDALLDGALEVTNAERAFVVAADPKGDLTPVRMRNFEAEISKVDARETFARTPVRVALEARRTYVSMDAQSDPLLEESDSLDELGLHVVAIEPLLVGTRLVGALAVDSRVKAREPYSKAALATLAALAAKAAVVLDRLRGPILREVELEARRPAVPMPRGFIANAKSMKRVLDAVRRVAPFDTTVLVTGETGTGKEAVARALHALGARSKGPFVAVNMGILTESLAESLLYGHEAGAFSGASTRHVGYFEQANGGTLFLDEIGELKPPVQTMLLRALQERKVRRVGGTVEIPVDVRVVAATHRNLPAMASEGEFREDLYYRLSVVTIELPALRQRKEDVGAIARSTVAELHAKNPAFPATLSPAAIDRLLSHSWPGNIRELRNVIESAVVTAGAEIRPEDIVFRTVPREEEPTSARERKRKAFRGHLLDGKNVKEAAELTGIAESTAHLWKRELEKGGELPPRRKG